MDTLFTDILLILGAIGGIAALLFLVWVVHKYGRDSRVILKYSTGQNNNGQQHELRLYIINGDKRTEIDKFYVKKHPITAKLTHELELLNLAERKFILTPHSEAKFVVRRLDVQGATKIQFCVRYNKWRTAKTQWIPVHELGGLLGVTVIP